MCSHSSRGPLWYKGTTTRIEADTPCDCTTSQDGFLDISLNFMDFEGVEGVGADDYGCWAAVRTGVFEMCTFEVRLAGEDFRAVTGAGRSST